MNIPEAVFSFGHTAAALKVARADCGKAGLSCSEAASYIYM
ncbi:hypothetical protein [Agriterribacter sp.]|nr:hypothetical protein [Agriterribacter sp.]